MLIFRRSVGLPIPPRHERVGELMDIWAFIDRSEWVLLHESTKQTTGRRLQNCSNTSPFWRSSSANSQRDNDNKSNKLTTSERKVVGASYSHAELLKFDALYVYSSRIDIHQTDHREGMSPIQDLTHPLSLVLEARQVQEPIPHRHLAVHIPVFYLRPIMPGILRRIRWASTRTRMNLDFRA